MPCRAGPFSPQQARRLRACRDLTRERLSEYTKRRRLGGPYTRGEGVGARERVSVDVRRAATSQGGLRPVSALRRAGVAAVRGAATHRDWRDWLAANPNGQVLSSRRRSSSSPTTLSAPHTRSLWHVRCYYRANARIPRHARRGRGAGPSAGSGGGSETQKVSRSVRPTPTRSFEREESNIMVGYSRARGSLYTYDLASAASERST